MNAARFYDDLATLLQLQLFKWRDIFHANDIAVQRRTLLRSVVGGQATQSCFRSAALVYCDVQAVPLDCGFIRQMADLAVFSVEILKFFKYVTYVIYWYDQKHIVVILK